MFTTNTVENRNENPPPPPYRVIEYCLRIERIVTTAFRLAINVALWIVSALRSLPTNMILPLEQKGPFVDPLRRPRPHTPPANLRTDVTYLIPETQRDPFIRLLLPLAPEGYIFAVEIHLWNIPPEQREPFVELLLRLQPFMQPGHDLTTVMLLLRRIPAGQRVFTVDRIIESNIRDFELICNFLAQHFVPHPLQNPRQARPAAVTRNIHDRDTQTAEAINILLQSQNEIDPALLRAAYADLLGWLATQGAKGQEAIELLTQRNTGPFPDPLSTSQFTLNRYPVDGLNFLHHIAYFISQLPEPDRTNAQIGFLNSVPKACNEQGHPVCGPGRVQHIAVAVLNGRLKGVNIDGVDQTISTSLAIGMFFGAKQHQRAESRAALTQYARDFCNQNPAVDPDLFIKEIDTYADLQGMRD